MDEHKVQKWDGPIVVENRQQQIQLRENRKAAPAEIPNKSEKREDSPKGFSLRRAWMNRVENSSSST